MFPTTCNDYFCFEMKITKGVLSKLEDLITEGGYVVRYEKGNFKSGYCVLKETKLVLINNFLPLEGKANCLLELLPQLELKREDWSERSQKFWEQIKTSQIEIPFIPAEK